MRMTRISDQQYLRADQYRDASKLDARVELHKRFGTNPYGWHRWVFDRLNVAPHSRILELGCGPAYLWLENLDRMPDDLSVILSDLSAGMVEQARTNLKHKDNLFRFAVLDAQAVPFPDATFDVV